MLGTERGRAVMADAWALYDDAMEMLEEGRIRNAAEKAWGATKRATDAMVLEITAQEPQSAGQARSALLVLSRRDPEFVSLRGRYNNRSADLHVACFYDGSCEPESLIIEEIRETADYIRDAERLAESWKHGGNSA